MLTMLSMSGDDCRQRWKRSELKSATNKLRSTMTTRHWSAPASVLWIVGSIALKTLVAPQDSERASSDVRRRADRAWTDELTERPAPASQEKDRPDLAGVRHRGWRAEGAEFADRAKGPMTSASTNQIERRVGHVRAAARSSGDEEVHAKLGVWNARGAIQ